MSILGIIASSMHGGSPITATGGTVVTSGGYKYHTFTSNGTLTVTTGGNVEVMLVAGGGGVTGDQGQGGGRSTSTG